MNQQLTTDHYQEIGHMFCDTILDYCDPDQMKVTATLRELERLVVTGADDGGESDDRCGDQAQAPAPL